MMNAGKHPRYWPRLASLIWLTVGFLVLLSVGACRRGAPILDSTPRRMDAAGTISGTVRGPEGTSAIGGRLVEVVNVDTGERQQVTTNNAGGFTFKVAPGKYRVQVALRDGESILKQPGIMSINPSDVDAHADFVISTLRVSRPRNPARQADPTLAAPIA